MTDGEECESHSCRRIVRFAPQRLVEASQYRSFVQGDMIGFIALDFILRLIRAGTMNVTFVGNVPPMHFDNFPTHPAGFRIPTYMIANLECLDHGSVLL